MQKKMQLQMIKLEKLIYYMKNISDENILEEANLWINATHKVALATVIKTWGSSPRQVGSKMIVNEKGEFSGSISGLSLIHI